MMESMGAIRDCMHALGFVVSESHSHSIESRIINNLKPQLTGLIHATFHSNWHTGEGPFLSLSSVIRSFDIQYEEFKPKYQEFHFDKDNEVLSIKGDGYDFQLSFNKNFS